LIVILIKQNPYALGAWSAVCCGTVALALQSNLVFSQNKVTSQIETGKRTSNGLVIKSSGSVRTPQINAPARFKVPTTAQYRAIQQAEAERARKPDPRFQQSLRKNPGLTVSTGKSGARDVKK
jgi:hypothetical protein